MIFYSCASLTYVPVWLRCGRALGGGGGVLYCAAYEDCLSSSISSWYSAVGLALAAETNYALYGAVAATPPVLLTAPVTQQCDSDFSTVCIFNSAAVFGSTVTVPSGCPLSVSVRLSDALNNTVVSNWLTQLCSQFCRERLCWRRNQCVALTG